MRAEGAMQRAYDRRYLKQLAERRSVNTQFHSQRGKTMVAEDGSIVPAPTLPMIVFTGDRLFCQKPAICAVPAFIHPDSVMDSRNGHRGQWSCLAGHGGWVRLVESSDEPTERILYCHCGCGQEIEPERYDQGDPGNPPQYRVECLKERERDRAKKRWQKKQHQIRTNALARVKRLKDAKYCAVCSLRIKAFPFDLGGGQWRHNGCRSAVETAAL